MDSVVYLLPIALAEDGYDTLPVYLVEKINLCQVFFVENIRTARRAFKKIDPNFNIDSRDWHTIEEKEEASLELFKQCIQQKKTIGIVSESGCPGIADPGQKIISCAQELGILIKPISGPSSILLALMASGMNGQFFTFNGYLPIESGEREKKIKELEKKAMVDNCTQLFIETPYRNNSLLNALLKICKQETKICIAFNLSSKTEWIKTKTVAEWKIQIPEIPKEPAIFLIGR
jgi:16S rRNA (cytidine1402-2'-O)-methyltransferase